MVPKLALPFVELALHLHFRLHITGQENMPEGGCVVCPNHNHNSDLPLAACGISAAIPSALWPRKSSSISVVLDG